MTALLLILQFFTFATGQQVSVTIRIKSIPSFSADVRGSFPADRGTSRHYIWFLNQYAGMTDLGKRISPVYLYDRQGFLVSRRSLLADEGLNIGEFSEFGYSVDLRPRESRFAAAHLSWVNADAGVLMLDDLLPQELTKTATIKLELPDGWKATSTDYFSSMLQTVPSNEERNIFTVSNIEKGVVFIGRDDRRRVVWAGKARLVVNFRDDWQFSVDEGLDAAASIFTDYEETFGSALTGSFLIGLNKFPTSVGMGNWEADTRGRTVTIVSSDMPFKTQSMQRLHEQLRHELFHLWIPNGVTLTGNYDWFYEGFALYQSLKTGVSVNRLRFEDYLDTLSRAYEIDSLQSNKQSLVEASKVRWSGANTGVYARGMLVAFLCDLALMDASNGKKSIQVLLREVFTKHRPPKSPTEGNDAVISIMRNHQELSTLVDRYVIGSESLDWATLLKTAGIEPEAKDQVTRLKISAKLSGRQKKALDRLGYNNWRNLK